MIEIGEDIINAYGEYKNDGREYYNPFTKKAIYKNRKNWVLWISRTIGKEKTNQFLFLFEPPMYSVHSGNRLELIDFDYTRSKKKWSLYSSEEIKDGIHMKKARSLLSDIRNKAKHLTLEECRSQLHSFKNDYMYYIPNTNKSYKLKGAWKNQMRLYYSMETIRFVCFLLDSPCYSKISGELLTLNDYDYYRGFGGLFTAKEKDNHSWMYYRNYKPTEEACKKISQSLIDHYNSESGNTTKLKKSHSMIAFNKTEKGQKLKIIQRKKQSITMKKMIADGIFTPNITNSWTNWDATIIIDNKTKKFRSSWEACFWYCNQHLEFETLRVKHSNGCYIIDFYDREKGIIYEIKPKGRYNIEIHKMDTLLEYCIQQNLKFKWINEHNILDFIDSDVIMGNDSALLQYEKMEKGLNYI
jgi:hypothetical protein